jgi:hypothetical protein
MANPRFNRALKDLCEIIKKENFLFPQTQLKMVFAASAVESKITPGQKF